MNFFKKLGRILSAPSQPETPFYDFTVVCNRCGEQITGRINLHNDLSQCDPEDESSAAYICRKTLVGDQLCFQRVEVELGFDGQRKVVTRQIQGGKFVD